MILSEIKSLPHEDICLLLRFDNYSGSFICDCGEASLLTAKEAVDMKVLFISHTHIDHFVNFDFLLRHQLGTEKNYIVCGPPGICNHVGNRIRSYNWNLIEEGSVSYEVREILPSGKIRISSLQPPLWEPELLKEEETEFIYSNSKFQVQFGILDHKTPSICYKFEEHDTLNIDMGRTEFPPGKWIRELKTAYEKQDNDCKIEVGGEELPAKELFHLLDIKKGATLGVIMDHAANAANHEIIEGLFAHCDRVYIECYYKTEEKETADLNHHSYAQASGGVMRRSGVKEAIPIHFSRKYAEEDIESIRREFEVAYNEEG